MSPRNLCLGLGKVLLSGPWKVHALCQDLKDIITKCISINLCWMPASSTSLEQVKRMKNIVDRQSGFYLLLKKCLESMEAIGIYPLKKSIFKVKSNFYCTDDSVHLSSLSVDCKFLGFQLSFSPLAPAGTWPRWFTSRTARRWSMRWSFPQMAPTWLWAPMMGPWTSMPSPRDTKKLGNATSPPVSSPTSTGLRTASFCRPMMVLGRGCSTRCPVSLQGARVMNN